MSTSLSALIGRKPTLSTPGREISRVRFASRRRSVCGWLPHSTADGGGWCQSASRSASSESGAGSGPRARERACLRSLQAFGQLSSAGLGACGVRGEEPASARQSGWLTASRRRLPMRRRPQGGPCSSRHPAICQRPGKPAGLRHSARRVRLPRAAAQRRVGDPMRNTDVCRKHAPSRSAFLLQRAR